MRKNCTCQGTNENCYRCFGRGYYDENNLKALPISNLSDKKKVENFNIFKIKSISNSFTKCKHCKVLVRSDRIDNHVRKVHGNCLSKSPKELSQNRPAQNKLTPNSSKKFCVSRSNKSIVKCKYCNSLVRNDRIDNHIRKVHGICLSKPKSSNKLPQNKQNKQTWSKYSSQNNQNNPNNNDYISRQMDGSKDLYVIRDQGEFGSLPSFDSMDDESSP